MPTFHGTRSFNGTFQPIQTVSFPSVDCAYQIIFFYQESKSLLETVRHLSLSLAPESCAMIAAQIPKPQQVKGCRQYMCDARPKMLGSRKTSKPGTVVKLIMWSIPS